MSGAAVVVVVEVVDVDDANAFLLELLASRAAADTSKVSEVESFGAGVLEVSLICIGPTVVVDGKYGSSPLSSESVIFP